MRLRDHSACAIACLNGGAAMIEPVDDDKIISMRVKGFSEREICKKLHCEISDVHAAIDGLARSMLNDSTRYRQLAIELARTEALVKTFTPQALSGDAQSAMVLAKLSESTRIMLGLGAPRDAHSVLEQAAEPQRQTSIDRISAVIERLCATPASDPDAPADGD
jgi:hypothetical protein